MMGVIMGQMTYYYKNQASFTKDELEFLNEIVPLELINKNYNPRNFNIIKWKVKDFNKKANNNFSGLMNLYMNKSIQNPTMFIKSVLNMTSPVWETRQNLTDIDYSVLTYPSDLMNKGKMKNISDNVYGKLITYNQYISTTPLRWLFIDFGQGLFLMIFGMSMMLKNRNKIKKMFTIYFSFVKFS